MKSYRISATFPELPAAHAEQQAQVEASNIGTALRLALTGGASFGDAILKRPGVKRRKIKTAMIRVSLIEPVAPRSQALRATRGLPPGGAPQECSGCKEPVALCACIPLERAS